jgi:chromate transporter
MGSPAEVFVAFLKLGLTSFGGPIAHLGYFHRELIERRRWLDETQYAHLVGLCQFLPGPASSQLGFALGTLRAGWMGGVAAFLAFTLPSALLLLAFAQILPMLEAPVGQAAIHGLKLVAVAVVAQAVMQMARRLTPDVPRALIAVASVAVIIVTSAGMQLVVVVMGAALGMLFCRQRPEAAGTPFRVHYGTRTGIALVAIFAALLAASFAAVHAHAPLIAVAGAFYRTGALVFGGGHVVLPLLQEAVVTPGWISTDEFLAGYGAAQAVPGPMFSIAAFLGARLEGGQAGFVGACVSVLAIFLPGLLLVSGALPLWQSVSRRAGSINALAGINAAVVGLLAAALYDPLWTGAVNGAADFIIVLGAFTLLAATRVPVLLVLGGCVAASVGVFWLGPRMS